MAFDKNQKNAKDIHLFTWNHPKTQGQPVFLHQKSQKPKNAKDIERFSFENSQKPKGNEFFCIRSFKNKKNAKDIHLFYLKTAWDFVKALFWLERPYFV